MTSVDLHLDDSPKTGPDRWNPMASESKGGPYMITPTVVGNVTRRR